MIVPASIVIDGGSPSLRFNIPKAIAISGRTISIEWLHKAYGKDPEVMFERFIFCVVQELIWTISFKQTSEYRGVIADRISRGLSLFLKQYAHLMFNQDAAYPYKTLATFPDEVEIDGRLWMMDRFKRPDVSSKSAISGLIAEVAEIYLSTEPLISLDYFELRRLAKTFAAKFCTFIELNAVELFCEKHHLADDNDSLLSQIAALRAENFALQSRLSIASNEDERERLRKVNKDLNEANTSISNELRILKKTVAVLMKENADLEDQLKCKGCTD